MVDSKYGKYVIKEPKLIREMAFHDFNRQLSGFTYPAEIYIDKELIKESNQYIDICWVWELPNPATMVGVHSHPFDEMVIFIGSNPKDMRDFGGEVEFWLGKGDDAEKFTVDTTTLFYVPRGLVHGPLTYNRVDKPSLLLAIGINTGGYF